MASDADLEQALHTAYAAGNIDAARQIAQEIHSRRSSIHQAIQPEPGRKSDGSFMDGVGLAARAVTKAGAALPAMFADAVTGPMNWAQDKLLGPGRGYRFQSQLSAIDDQFDRMNVPRPGTGAERALSSGLEMGTGAALGAKAAGWAANQFGPGVTRQVLQRMADDPALQAATGAGAGAAASYAHDQGAPIAGQIVASVAGGLGGAAAAGGARAAAGAAQRLLGPSGAPAGQNLEQRIIISLQQQGIDPATVTPAMRAALLRDAQESLKVTGGSLDDAALARLADYRRLGLTPTRGRVTLDPYDVTKEQNAMRLAAATGAREARLPQIANQNNQGLVGHVDRMGVNEDVVGAGVAGAEALRAIDAQMKAVRSAAYRAADEASGGSTPLSAGAIFTPIWEHLDAKKYTAFLPEKIANMMGKMSRGEWGTDLDSIETLRKMVNADMRTTNDGTAKIALAELSRMLDDVPLVLDKSAFGGGQVANGATAAAMRAADDAPARAQEALQTARRANKSWMDWRQGDKLRAGMLEDGGMLPDSLIDKIVSKGTGHETVQALAEDLSRDPSALQAVRDAILFKLKQAGGAAGRSSNDTVQFSGIGWNRLLEQIGSRKLSAFFSPEEIEQLRSIGRVGEREIFQPRGSAVNNSNTGPMMGRLISSIADRIRPYTGMVPFGRELQGPIDNISIGIHERGARMPIVSRPYMDGNVPGLLDQFLIPGMVAGGLLGQ
jgi:hypothetical protein